MCLDMRDFLFEFMITDSKQGNRFSVVKVRKNSFDFQINDDYRNNTIKYTVYKQPDGFRVRRWIVNRWCHHESQPYQLFRNSRTGYWESFTTAKELIHRLNIYANR